MFCSALAPCEQCNVGMASDDCTSAYADGILCMRSGHAAALSLATLMRRLRLRSRSKSQPFSLLCPCPWRWLDLFPRHCSRRHRRLHPRWPARANCLCCTRHCMRSRPEMKPDSHAFPDTLVSAWSHRSKCQWLESVAGRKAAMRKATRRQRHCCSRPSSLAAAADTNTGGRMGECEMTMMPMWERARKMLKMDCPPTLRVSMACGP